MSSPPLKAVITLSSRRSSLKLCGSASSSAADCTKAPEIVKVMKIILHDIQYKRPNPLFGSERCASVPVLVFSSGKVASCGGNQAALTSVFGRRATSASLL